MLRITEINLPTRYKIFVYFNKYCVKYTSYTTHTYIQLTHSMTKLFRFGISVMSSSFIFLLHIPINKKPCFPKRNNISTSDWVLNSYKLPLQNVFINLIFQAPDFFLQTLYPFVGFNEPISPHMNRYVAMATVRVMRITNHISRHIHRLSRNVGTELLPYAA
jgi:hypothetical protein